MDSGRERSAGTSRRIGKPPEYSGLPETEERMPNSTGTPAPGDHRDDDDDALDFPAEAEPTDDTPTIISKTQPIAPPQAAKDHVTDLGPRGAMSESVMASLRGRKLAHFELIEPIGVGGMAAVLRAHDTQLDRQVALKILPPDMATDPEIVA